MTRAIAVYVSGHGFGHTARVAEVVRTWLAREPDVVVHVRSTTPSWLFPAAPGHVAFRPGVTDVGLVQTDCLTIDFPATLKKLDELEKTFDARVETESGWLAAIGAELVLADVPPIAFAAAERAGVPSFGLANFSWDWMYAHYAAEDGRFAVHAARAARCYRSARSLCRLPFHADMSSFPKIVDVPLVARRSPLSRREARAAQGLPEDRPVVLLSFGGIGYPGLEAERLGEIRDVCFVTTDRMPAAPPNVIALSNEGLDYVALLAACDAVVTKPGWGIVAACLANGVRLLCAWRAEFPEAPILVRALERHATVEFVSSDDLARVRFADRLEALLERRVAPAALPIDGATEVVETIRAERPR